jgi:hypothetical protein
MRSDIMAVKMWIVVVSFISLCSPVGGYQHFRGMFYLNFRAELITGNTFLQNVGTHLQDYMDTQLRRLQSKETNYLAVFHRNTLIQC